MTLTLPNPDSRRRTSLPHLHLVHNSGVLPSKTMPGNHLSDEERAAFIVASSTRRPSVPHFFPTPAMSSPPSSVASSPGEHRGLHPLAGSAAASGGPNTISPILTPFQWTSDLRQYIMTDIGPQPSNSQMPTLRSHSHLVRQVSCSKISPVGAPANAGGNGNGGMNHNGTINSSIGPRVGCGNAGAGSELPTGAFTPNSAHSRYSTITDLCTIPQDEVLPPMQVPLERRFAHTEWDDEDEE